VKKRETPQEKANRLLAEVAAGSRNPGRVQIGDPLLYLSIKWSRKPPGWTASWQLRFHCNGKSRLKGLGSYPLVKLAEAKHKALQERASLSESRWRREDPAGAGSAPAVRTATAMAAAQPTFSQCVEDYIGSHHKAWRSKDHARQWRTTLAPPYVPGWIAAKPVGEIDAADVLEILEPHWQRIPKTAQRLRGRLEAILDYAKANGWRTGDNPAQWKSHLQHRLPAAGKLHAVRHHPALPYDQLPGFMAELRDHEDEDEVSRALQFVILTACRTNEARLAGWLEIDRANKIWTIPASRMKTGNEHRVPLTDAALALPGAPATGLIFPTLSRDAMQDRLQRLCPGFHVHGFRSSFRDWCADTGAPRELAEAALAHRIGNAVEMAYQRSTMLARRRLLMEAWGAFCLTPPAANVVPLRA
jgi:integrase